MDYLPVAALLAAGVSIASAAYSSRAWPIGVRSRVQALSDRVDAAEANVEAIASKWRAASAEQAEFLEAAEGVLNAVETKRRRIAAHVSAAERKNGATPQPGDYNALKRLARERGFQV